MSLYIVIPTYNEKENIENILSAIKDTYKKNAIEGGVIVVDDGSPDGTGAIVKGLQKTLKEKSFNLELIERTGKLGLGTAYIAGFKKALSLNADYIMEMDADFSHSPNDIPRFVKELRENNADLVIGSRYVTKGNVKNWNKFRVLISKSGSLYSRMILGWSVKDATAGFLGYRKEVLESMNLDDIKSNGYSFQVEMKYRTFKNGFKLKEIPIVFVDRVAGTSKMSSKIVFEAMAVVLKLRKNIHASEKLAAK